MKKSSALILASLIAVVSTTTAFAQERRDERREQHREHREFRGYSGERHDGPAWLIPLMIGGALGWELRNEQPAPAPVVQAPPIPPGVTPQPVYVLQWVYYPDCNCYKQQYIQTGWR